MRLLDINNILWISRYHDANHACQHWELLL